MNSLKTPIKSICIVVYCKDNYILHGKINAQGYDRFSDFYEDNNNLHMYDAEVKRKSLDGGIYSCLSSEYICVPKENIIFCFPE